MKIREKVTQTLIIENERESYPDNDHLESEGNWPEHAWDVNLDNKRESDLDHGWEGYNENKRESDLGHGWDDYY